MPDACAYDEAMSFCEYAHSTTILSPWTQNDEETVIRQRRRNPIWCSVFFCTWTMGTSTLSLVSRRRLKRRRVVPSKGGWNEMMDVTLWNVSGKRGPGDRPCSSA